MNDLEKQIRNLTLQAPGKTLDERVLSVLEIARPCSAEKLQATSGENGMVASVDHMMRPLQSNHRTGATTPAWIVASVSILIGAMVGNVMPLLSSARNGGTGSTISNLISTEFEENADGLPAMAEGGRDNLVPEMSASAARAGVGSQIVESIWISPMAAAVVWEQQTGQIFSVGGHVNDRRFDRCRNCHRVGG